MDVPPTDKGDFVVRTRSVLWRAVARVGGSKELARAHVNLPAEAVKALELDSKGDTVAFIVRTGSNNVILTNLFESQRSTTSRWSILSDHCKLSLRQQSFSYNLLNPIH
jgi:hypothetical protein